MAGERVATPNTCRAVLSAYDHWSCQHRRFHLGRHRFNNYTGARFPRLWRLNQWVRTIRGNRRLRGYGKLGSKPRLISHRSYLFPVRYEPVPVGMPDHVRSKDQARYFGAV